MVTFDYDGTDYRIDLIVETEDWLQTVAVHHGRTLQQLTYILTSDEHLRYLNQKYLAHDTDTDILTFDYSESQTHPIVCDVFVSVERIQENAREFRQPFVDELHRVMAHGLLHLCGYNDNTTQAKSAMTAQEDLALSLRIF
jgi:probable rRNA maturation factor